MKKPVLKLATAGGICLGVGLVVLVAAYAWPTAMQQPPSGLVLGDVNLDGVADLGDIEAFARALGDPAAWQQEHGRSWADLLAVADFDADGELTIGDIRQGRR